MSATTLDLPSRRLMQSSFSFSTFYLYITTGHIILLYFLSLTGLIFLKVKVVNTGGSSLSDVCERVSSFIKN